MKTLQNNFTTPEQSKRLLELGVPRWTADEYRDEKGYRHSLEGILDVELFFQNLPDYLPCWSVGRLIEIYLLLREVDEFEYVFNLGRDHIEDIVRMYEKTASKLDFSKFED